MSSIIMRFREGVLAVAVGAGAGLAGSFLVARHMWQRTGEACDGIDACTNAMRAERGLRPRRETGPTRVQSGFEAHLRHEFAVRWNAQVEALYKMLKSLL